MPYTDITSLPTAPSRARPSTFAAEGDAFLAALATFVTEVNASGTYIDGVGTDVDADATAAAASVVSAAAQVTLASDQVTLASNQATAAANSATAASNSASSVASGAWSSGTSYSVGTIVYSPITYLSYRAITTHSGESTDPSSDATNWIALGGISGLTASVAELNKLDGATVTTAEINKLDGATVTTAEINYNDVTTLGLTEASKTVTADSNGVVTFDNGIYEEYTAVTSSSNASTINLRDGTNFSHVLTENTTFTFSNPAASGKVSSFTLKLVQDSSASGYAVTFPSSVDWPAATAPTLTATASAVDYFVFITHDGGTTYYGFTAGQALG